MVAGRYGLESRKGIYASVAQLVEHDICNVEVEGSIDSLRWPMNTTSYVFVRDQGPTTCRTVFRMNTAEWSPGNKVEFIPVIYAIDDGVTEKPKKARKPRKKKAVCKAICKVDSMMKKLGYGKRTLEL